MVKFADYQMIDAQINHIYNRSKDGQFSTTGDTGPSADKRYSDAGVTESRRKAAHRIIQAIATNIAGPFWGYLKVDVPVVHGDTIPPHYGQIGAPMISMNGVDFRTGFPADPDEIDSYRSDQAETFSNLFGVMPQSFAVLSEDGLMSPMAFKYSTDS